MHSLHSILGGIREGNLLTSLDLTETYLHVPIRSFYQRFLKFHFAGCHFQYRAPQMCRQTGSAGPLKITPSSGCTQIYSESCLRGSTSQSWSCSPPQGTPSCSDSSPGLQPQEQRSSPRSRVNVLRSPWPQGLLYTFPPLPIIPG